MISCAIQAAVTSQAGTVLNASGYVTARRQATVSSKITGRVVDVLIEEGDTPRPGGCENFIFGDNDGVQLAPDAPHPLDEAAVAAAAAALADGKTRRLDLGDDAELFVDVQLPRPLLDRADRLADELAELERQLADPDLQRHFAWVARQKER